MPQVNSMSPPEVYRIWNPETREVLAEVLATYGASDRALTERTVRDTAAHHPGACVQVYRAGEWRPWLRVAED